MTREEEKRIINQALPSGVHLVNYGNGCPWQADAVVDGKQAYFRFRHNHASMTVWEGEAWKSPVLLAASLYPYFDPESDRSCSNDAGTLDSTDEVIQFTQRLVAALAPHDSVTNPTSQEMLLRAVARLREEMKACETYDTL